MRNLGLIAALLFVSACATSGVDYGGLTDAQLRQQAVQQPINAESIGAVLAYAQRLQSAGDVPEAECLLLRAATAEFSRQRNVPIDGARGSLVMEDHVRGLSEAKLALWRLWRDDPDHMLYGYRFLQEAANENREARQEMRAFNASGNAPVDWRDLALTSQWPTCPSTD